MFCHMYDVIVIGLGTMGAATAYQLAKRGVDVLGLDRYTPPHSFGSTHGGTRITREAIGEGAHYVPLARRSHEIWRAIEGETGTELFTANGALMLTSAASRATTHVEGFFDNTIAAARSHNIAHELLDAAQIRARFPQFRVRGDETAYFEPGAGFVRPEAAVAAQLSLAKKHGAKLHAGETVTGISQSADGVRVTTDKDVYEARNIVLAAGAWLPQFLPAGIAEQFRIYRQVQFWFAPEEPAKFAPENFPIFIWNPPDRDQPIYGFPDVDGAGFKIATEQYAQTTMLEAYDTNVSESEIAAMYRDFVAPHFPGITSRCLHSATCLYTVAPDFRFVIDTLPDNEHITIVSACSGHGFKHSPAIGEAVAQRLCGEAGGVSLAPFCFSRFGA